MHRLKRGIKKSVLIMGALIVVVGVVGVSQKHMKSNDTAKDTSLSKEDIVRVKVDENDLSVYVPDTHTNDTVINADNITSLKNTTPSSNYKDQIAVDGLTSLAVFGFETETIQPSKTPSEYDLLHVKLSSGQEGDLAIQYEGGTQNDRYARIVSDSANEGNHVLQFWLKNPKVPGSIPGRHKGRIQLNLVNVNQQEVVERYRMYLDNDMSLYRSYPKENTWFTINELWMGETWKGEQHPFRITLNIAKESGEGKPLLFSVEGSQNKDMNTWVPVWGDVNRKFEIPVGEWMDVELYYKQGDKNTGRFRLKVKRAADVSMVTVLDIYDWTYDPNAEKPIPLTTWHPVKLYSSQEIINHIRNNGGVAQIYWDDIEIFGKPVQ